MSNHNLNKWIQFCFLLLFLIYSKNGKAHSDNPLNGRTGQIPSVTCATSIYCHAGIVNDDGGIEIKITGNPEIFVSGEIYEISVKVTDPLAACFGFQIGVQFEDDRSAGGEFIVPENAQGFVLVDAGLYQYVEHNMPSTTGVWVFEWKAPSDNRGSNIIFYAAGIASSCNGEPQNAATYLTTKTMASSCGGITIAQTSIDCDFTELEPKTILYIDSISGGSGEYTIVPFGESIVSENIVHQNESFIYYVNKNDIEQNEVGFEVTDGLGNICRLDETSVNTLKDFFEFSCNRPCPSNIELSFQNGIINEFNCDELKNITIQINAINGGSRNLFHLSTLGFGTLSDETVSSSDGFTYSFNLEDATDKTIGFIVNDRNGCAQQFDYTQNIPFDELQDLCPLNCPSNIEIEVVGGLDEPEIICNDANPSDILYYIDIESVSGGENDNYTIETNGGDIEANTNNIAEGFFYIFTQQVVDDEEAMFAINNSDLCVETFNFNNYFSSVTLEELCVCDITGCLDETACNYNPMACIDDGSCQSTSCSPGCTDVCAPNYDPNADENDGSCELYNTTCNEDCNVGDVQTWDTNTCSCITITNTERITGCTDTNACNYTPNANCDDGSCLLTPVCNTDICLGNIEVIDPDNSCNCILSVTSIRGCTDSSACNFNTSATCEDDSCEYGNMSCSYPCNPILGCTDATACNYNNMACIDDDTCITTGCEPGCTDACAPNYNPEADENDGSCEPYDTTCNNDCILGDIQDWDATTCNCITISESIKGCTDESATNYNPSANCNDDSCTFSEPTGCTDPCADNYDSSATIDDDSCEEYDTTCNINCTIGAFEVWDTENCQCVVTNICDETCDASAGELRPIKFDTFCTLSAMVTLPVQFGYNINLEYIFLITNQNLEIFAQSSDFRTNLTGLPAGEYCIYGMSYDANNSPDLSVSSIDELMEQSTTCFSITRECIPLTIQAETTNPFPPVGPSDTLFYCTGYTVPIDFCIDLADEDGGQAYLVDIISFCNPSIEGDNCVHYPPLPGLLVGDTEIISLIYCDDDCPQLCDTSYAAISILDDCTNFMQPDSISTNCIADTIYTCVEPGIATELCPDCSYATTEYFINNISSLSNAAVEVKSGNCLNYTADAGFETDSLIIELCSWEIVNCVEKLFVIEIDDCDTEEACPQLFACMPPIVEKRICLDCEAAKFPNAVITDIQSKFDECVINLIDQMCFDYIPLPLMNILETDTALITYCDELTNDCYETDVIITYSNCDGGGLQVVAANDYFEAFENEPIELPVLENDENTGSAVLNIAQTPENGQVLITENQVIQYIPEENFVGNDQFIYEICTFANCYQAEVLIEVYPEHRTLQQEQLTRAYPNPASNQITIEYDLKFDTDVWIMVYNPLGEVIYSTKSQTNAGFQKYIIDVTQFNRGIYFFNVSLGSKKQCHKILVD